MISITVFPPACLSPYLPPHPLKLSPCLLSFRLPPINSHIETSATASAVAARYVPAATTWTLLSQPPPSQAPSPPPTAPFSGMLPSQNHQSAVTSAAGYPISQLGQQQQQQTYDAPAVAQLMQRHLQEQQLWQLIQQQKQEQPPQLPPTISDTPNIGAGVGLSSATAAHSNLLSQQQLQTLLQRYLSLSTLIGSVDPAIVNLLISSLQPQQYQHQHPPTHQHPSLPVAGAAGLLGLPLSNALSNVLQHHPWAPAAFDAAATAANQHQQSPVIDDVLLLDGAGVGSASSNTIYHRQGVGSYDRERTEALTAAVRAAQQQAAAATATAVPPAQGQGSSRSISRHHSSSLASSSLPSSGPATAAAAAAFGGGRRSHPPQAQPPQPQSQQRRRRKRRRRDHHHRESSDAHADVASSSSSSSSS
jgi:hypothetical protein